MSRATTRSRRALQAKRKRIVFGRIYLFCKIVLFFERVGRLSIIARMHAGNKVPQRRRTAPALRIGCSSVARCPNQSKRRPHHVAHNTVPGYIYMGAFLERGDSVDLMHAGRLGDPGYSGGAIRFHECDIIGDY